MKGPQPGFLRVMYLKNGMRQGLCYGFTGNVCLRNCQCSFYVDACLILQRVQAKPHSCM